MTYDPLTGDGYTGQEAWQAWAVSMDRANHESPRWSLRGATPAEFYWSFFNFKPYRGTVHIEADGFHWQTVDYDSGAQLHDGVTTSLYEAYQSVEQNKTVRYGGGG